MYFRTPKTCVACAYGKEIAFEMRCMHPLINLHSAAGYELARGVGVLASKQRDKSRYTPWGAKKNYCGREAWYWEPMEAEGATNA